MAALKISLDDPHDKFKKNFNQNYNIEHIFSLCTGLLFNSYIALGVATTKEGMGPRYSHVDGNCLLRANLIIFIFTIFCMFFSCFFVLFHSFCLHAQVFETTFVHEFHIFIDILYKFGSCLIAVKLITKLNSLCTIGRTSRATFRIPAKWLNITIYPILCQITFLEMLQYRYFVFRIVSAVRIPKQSVALDGIYCDV